MSYVSKVGCWGVDIWVGMHVAQSGKVATRLACHFQRFVETAMLHPQLVCEPLSGDITCHCFW
jgi:hypothetical protein